MKTQHIRRLERLETERVNGHEIIDVNALVSALSVALKGHPEELTSVIAHLSAGRLNDAKDMLERFTTGEEEQHVLTPRAVGGVLHLLRRGILDSSPQSICEKLSVGGSPARV